MSAQRILLILFLMGMASVVRAQAFPDKKFPWDRVKGVVASDFKEDFLERVAIQLTKIPCYGRCTESVAACLAKNPPHPTASRLSRSVLSLMSEGADEQKIMDWLQKRKGMAQPAELMYFDLEGLTPRGKKDAPVVIVEYSDFQCPFCAQLAPVIEQVIDEYKDKVCLYFKQFPLKTHPNALEAAKACVAADSFGKFWAYCGQLYRQRENLSEEALLALAEQTGMKRADFEKAMEAESVLNRIADEKLEGIRNQITATPALFINGKAFLLQPSLALLRERIEEELDILSKRD